MSSSTTHKNSFPKDSKKIENWTRAYKKASGQKKQTVLPSAVTANNEWAVRTGWSLIDATTWRSLCEKAKYANDEAEGDGILSLMFETIEIAGHCDTHPIGIINFARCAHDRKSWDLETIDYLQSHLLKESDLQENGEPVSPELFPESGEPPAAPRKRVRKYEASQPRFLDEDDTVDVDADVDDK